MNSLKEILDFRRAVRHYSDQPIDAEVVKQCAEEAVLAPTSSNMQLYEMYHITDKQLLKEMEEACFAQEPVITAQQLMVFVTRQDKYKEHAAAVLAFEKEDIRRNSPADKQEARIKRREVYYGKLVPFLYARCWGVLGFFRKAIMMLMGWFKPVVRQYNASRRQMTEGDYRVVVHKSCALVAQTFMLAMAEKGYDTCPLEGFDAHGVRKLLNLPSGAEVSLVVSCGIRSDKGVWFSRFRFPVEELYKRV